MGVSVGRNTYLSLTVMSFTKVASVKTTGFLSSVEDVVKPTVSAVKGTKSDSKVTVARLLQLWALATLSILSANNDKPGKLHT